MAGGVNLGTEEYSKDGKMITYIGVVGEGDNRRLVHTSYGNVAESVSQILQLDSSAVVFEFLDIDERRGFIGKFESIYDNIRNEALTKLDSMVEYTNDNEKIAA